MAGGSGYAGMVNSQGSGAWIDIYQGSKYPRYYSDPDYQRRMVRLFRKYRDADTGANVIPVPGCRTVNLMLQSRLSACLAGDTSFCDSKLQERFNNGLLHCSNTIQLTPQGVPGLQAGEELRFTPAPPRRRPPG